MRLAQRGLAYGSHLIVTANRWDDLSRALRDLVGNRLELRLADPQDSLFPASPAESVPDDGAGNGLCDALRCAVQAPVFDVDFPPAPGPSIRELVPRINDARQGHGFHNCVDRRPSSTTANFPKPNRTPFPRASTGTATRSHLRWTTGSTTS